LDSEIKKAVTYHLEPGYVYYSGKGAVIRTVVGSCVAVCLWDSRKHAGGMNHFMHAGRGENDKRTTYFGDVALPVLVNMMHREFGSKKTDLHVRIYGGGSPMNFNEQTIGEDNIAITREFIQKVGTRLVSEDVGGTLGRKLLFDTATGQVAILKVQQLRREDWVIKIT
jgi:chemotaxis protein CheD